jgi:hypothetical protein
VAVALGAFALVSDKVLRLAGGGVKMAMLELAESNGYELPARKKSPDESYTKTVDERVVSR